MFGDDPDPSVTTERFRFKKDSDAHTRGGLRSEQRDSGLSKKENKHPGCKGSEKCQQIQTGSGTTNGCKFYENMRMQCS